MELNENVTCASNYEVVKDIMVYSFKKVEVKYTDNVTKAATLRDQFARLCTRVDLHGYRKTKSCKSGPYPWGWGGGGMGGGGGTCPPPPPPPGN